VDELALTDQKCPMCGRAIKLVPTTEGLLIQDLDGREHKCKEKKPIGELVAGRVVEDFKVQNHECIITLDGDYELIIKAPGRRLWFDLKTPDGVFHD